MGGLIWFVVIVYIIVRCVNKSKENKRQKQNRSRYTKPQQRLEHRQVQQKRAHQKQTAEKTIVQPSILERAKENVASISDGDGIPAKRTADLSKVPVAEEILRDKALDRHVHTDHENDHATDLKNEPGVNDFDTYHLMEEVQDLIVMGYQPHLEFERDFLAEGIDMLGSMCG